MLCIRFLLLKLSIITIRILILFLSQLLPIKLHLHPDHTDFQLDPVVKNHTCVYVSLNYNNISAVTCC